MKSLVKFLDNISIGNGKEIEAYRMDNTDRAIDIPDMRGVVGLGACNCCDRFFIFGDKIFILEETRLQDTIQDIYSKYEYLEDDDKQKIATKLIRQENYVKIYGAMLVLCRLSTKYDEVAKAMGGKKHNFWLIAEQSSGEEIDIYFDYLKNDLLSDLRGILTKRIIDQVEVMTPDILSAKLLENATDS